MFKLVSGPINRSGKKQRLYMNHLKNQPSKDGCNFCKFESENKDQVISTHRHVYTVSNIFDYDLWDGHTVREHMMIVPKRHVVSLSELDNDEREEWFSLMSEYEKQGYSVYSRSPGDHTKSVAHQHTHLIKLSTTKSRFLLYVSKPHILLHK